MIRKLLCIILFVSFTINAQTFLKRDGKKIVDGNGNEVILKGTGLGGWMVQEGYMFQTSGFADAEHEIRDKIEELVGYEKMIEYYDYFHQNFVTEADIAAMAQWGFNSVRMPMHWNKLMETSVPFGFVEKGFTYIDNLIAWCKKYDMYVILDLHAAPGGQSDEPISDYDPSKPSLWESEVNKNLTVDLWAEIARRYKDEPTVGGYDLINETKWPLPNENQALRELYIRITDAIREVDQNHLIFIEGNWFANDFTGLGDPWDDNMSYSFHKYWNANDQGAIGWMLGIRNDTDCPLWLGETGENSNSWNLDCIRLMDNNDIGWSFWTLKRIETIRAPLSITKTDDYQRLLNYWNGGGSKPDADFAFNALIEQVDMMKFENCNFKKGYIDAMFRQFEENTAVPFKEHNIPGRFYAADYDMGPRGVAWQDSEYEMINGSWFNNGWSYRGDGVDIEPCNDSETNGYNVGWIDSQDWLNFTVNVQQEGTYDIAIRVAGFETGGKIAMNIGSEFLFSWIDVPYTSGNQSWRTVTVEDVFVPGGEQVITVRFLLGGFNLNYIEFIPKTVSAEEENNLPDEYSLSQNYPNPFNPATTIKYSIPVSSIQYAAGSQNKQSSNQPINQSEVAFVSLIVYDLLGKEVATLVNREQRPGEYEVEFDASNLSSGTYFYTLKADNFVSTKKMILLK